MNTPTKKNNADDFVSLMKYDGVKEARQLVSNGGHAAPELTSEEKGIIQKHSYALKSGLFAIVPLRCPGNGICPFSDACPYVQLNKEPIGDPCPIEQDVAVESTQRYIEEFNVDPLTQYSQYRLVLMLARLDVYEMRVVLQLSHSDAALFTQEDTVGITPDGRVVTQTTIHKAWEILNSIDNKRLKIMRALVATPREQYKKEAALKTTDDKASTAVEYARVKASVDAFLDKLTRSSPTYGGETIVEAT